MRVIDLEGHPLVRKLNEVIEGVKSRGDCFTHLLLPPEYNLPDEPLDPTRYLFVQDVECSDVLTHLTNKNYILKIHSSKLAPVSGFAHSSEIDIFQSIPVMMPNGYSLVIHELASNPYEPSPIPPLCIDINAVISHPGSSALFLKEMIHSERIMILLEELKKSGEQVSFKKVKLSSILQLMHAFMDIICEIVYDCQPFQIIPSVFRTKTNEIIFYTVASAYHTKMLRHYHNKYKKENYKTMVALRSSCSSMCDIHNIKTAAMSIESLHESLTIEDSISKVRLFYREITMGMGEKTVSADALLPAICHSFSLCDRFSSYIYSTFKYISDILPTEGLDENILCIITNCSVAALHNVKNKKSV